MRNSFRLCEDTRPQRLPVSVSSKIKKSIAEIYKHNQNNPTALGQWSEYIEGLKSYISNPVIAFDYTNRYAHFPNGAIHLVEMNYDVSFITKSNDANGYVYVYIFDINFKLEDFGLRDTKITENKQYNIMKNTNKIRLTESQLHSVIKRVIMESFEEDPNGKAHRLVQQAMDILRDYLKELMQYDEQNGEGYDYYTKRMRDAYFTLAEALNMLNTGPGGFSYHPQEHNNFPAFV